MKHSMELIQEIEDVKVESSSFPLLKANGSSTSSLTSMSCKKVHIALTRFKIIRMVLAALEPGYVMRPISIANFPAVAKCLQTLENELDRKGASGGTIAAVPQNLLSTKSTKAEMIGQIAANNKEILKTMEKMKKTVDVGFGTVKQYVAANSKYLTLLSKAGGKATKVEKETDKELEERMKVIMKRMMESKTNE